MLLVLRTLNALKSKCEGVSAGLARLRKPRRCLGLPGAKVPVQRMNLDPADNDQEDGGSASRRQSTRPRAGSERGDRAEDRAVREAAREGMSRVGLIQGGRLAAFRSRARHPRRSRSGNRGQVLSAKGAAEPDASRRQARRWPPVQADGEHLGKVAAGGQSAGLPVPGGFETVDLFEAMNGTTVVPRKAPQPRHQGGRHREGRVRRASARKSRSTSSACAPKRQSAVLSQQSPASVVSHQSSVISPASHATRTRLVERVVAGALLESVLKTYSPARPQR